MRRARDSRVPPIPLNLSSMDRILQTAQWNAWTLAHGSRNERFYVRFVRSGGDILMFKSAYGCSQIPEANVQLFVGFLQARPRNPLAIQSVLTVGFFEENNGITRVSLVIY